jgi:short-subunit dehydrogenase
VIRTHVVTGAGSGIGRVLAERLRDRGDRLVLLLRDAQRINDLRSDFPEAVMVEADLARPASLTGLAHALPSTVDSLIQVAGLVELGPVSGLDAGAWQRQLDVNLASPALLTRELLPALRAGGGTVVFVNSTAALTPGPHWSAYAAAKAGLRALADSLRAEEASHGVRVSTVFPGRTATPMQEEVHRQEGRVYDAERFIAASTVADAIVHVLDLPRDATIPELTLRPHR